MNIANQEDTNHELEENVEILKSDRESLQEKNMKKEILLEDLQRQKEKIDQVLEQTKK